MHYHRQYRHGDADRTARGVRYHQRAYRSRYLPNHPLASRHGYVYVHRAVLYDALGPGPHPCHYCGTPLDWRHPDRRQRLQADHVNHDGADNRPDNLVPACPSCNGRRAQTRRANALRNAGWWQHHDTVAALRRGTRVPLD